MGILFLTVKQERCSDLLLWSAAWLLPPLRLMLMLTTATATALATEDSATLDLATATPVLATLMARGRLRLSPRLTPSTDTELTPTPSATPVSDTLVSDMLVLVTLVLVTLVLVTPTARGRPRLSPRLMLTMATELTPTPDTAMLVSATLPPTATATV